jgi:hypothetical protein
MRVPPGHVVLPAPPVFKEVVQTKGVSANGEGNLDHPAGSPTGKSAGPFQSCAEPEKGWEIVPNSEKVSFSETRPGCVTAQKAFSNQSKACFNVTLSINAGDNGDTNPKLG